MAQSTSPPAPDSPAAQLKRSAKTAAAWLWANITIGAFGVWAIGEVFRDSIAPTALCFLVPSAFISAALLITALLAFATGCRRAALAAAVALLFPTFWLFFVENQWVRPRPRGNPAQAIRLVHWNVGPVSRRPEDISRCLVPLQPDVVVLSEIGDRAASQRVATSLGRDYTVCHIRQIAVIARGSLAPARLDERMPSHLYCVDWRSPYGPLLLMTVDLPSRPFYSRQPWLQRVHERIVYLKPDVVVGDFNARRRSHWLGKPPRGYAHAYDEAGAGWSCSWPDGFPLWDIDQCLVGPRVRAIRYDMVGTGASDHRLQYLEFSLATAAE